jgi:hypothetical protein
LDLADIQNFQDQTEVSLDKSQILERVKDDYFDILDQSHTVVYWNYEAG